MALSFTHLTDLSLLLSTVALLLFPLLLQLFPLNLQLRVLHLQLPDLTLQLCYLLSPLSDLRLGLLQGGLCPRGPGLELLNLQLPLPQAALNSLFGGLLSSQTLLKLLIFFLFTCKLFRQAL